MTSKADYTEQEWVRLRRAPFVSGLAISIADPGGPIEMAKETMATLKAASTPPSQVELLVAVSQEILSMANQRQNPMAGFKPDSSALAGKMILDELMGVNEILTAKATPEEADAFRRWLLAAAQAAADGAKEGGFMGFGAELVSQGEQRMLTELRAALGVPEG
jgi:thymidine phosphorylase